MDLQPGKTLAHYCIVEKIGAGGMGEVYRAHDERLDRDVAVKVLPSGTLAGDAARRRFRMEALALSKLNHPNVATIFDFDTRDGIDFLVMELVSGETMVEKLQGGPLPEEEVTRLGLELVEGLKVAHEHGVIHRDLKPGNVRLTQDGRLKILDFGLAHRVRPETDAVTTATGTTQGPVGTLPYMAPEQVRGQRVDARADIWAAGAVLYEMATGRRAFLGTEGTRIIASILQDNPPPPRAVNPQVSGGLEAIILKCLEKEPLSRYQSTKELGTDLSRLRAGDVAGLARPRVPRRPVVMIAGLAALVLLVAFAVNLSRMREMPFGRTPSIRSLAVLPLSELSGTAEDEYFADGMTDELITTLARISALKVISRTSVMTFKNSKESLPQIARALHVDAVVEGSVSRSGDRVRIRAQLIRAATDEHLWAQSYERSMQDILSLQGELARAIADEIQVALTPNERERLTKAHPVDPEAYRAYLKGLYFWNKRTTPWIEKAIEQFNQAIEIDPSYALPYAGLALCYVVLPAYDPLQARDALPKAKAAAVRALALDGSLAEAHAVLSGTRSELEWDQEGAAVECRRAIALNPNYAPAHEWYADLLSCMGRHEEAIAEVKRAQDLDPLSLIVNTDVGAVLARAGHYDEAFESLRKTIDMDPSFPRAHMSLAFAYLFAGKCIEATWEFQKTDSLTGFFTPVEATNWYGPLRHAFKAGGAEGYYRQLLKQRLETMEERPAPPLRLAASYAMLGEVDSAFAWLARAREMHDPFVLRVNVEPTWANLRSDRRYEPFLRSIGLRP